MCGSNQTPDGKITEVRLEESGQVDPKILPQREEFLNKNLSLFSDQAKLVRKIHVEDNGEVFIEKFELQDEQGKGLGQVQLLLDKSEKSWLTKSNEITSTVRLSSSNVIGVLIGRQ